MIVARQISQLETTEKRQAIKSYTDLEVFQLAYSLILLIHKTTLDFSKFEQFGLGEQMRRASRSICANLAEGHAKRLLSAPEFKRFIMIAYGSAEEMRLWLRLSIDLGYVSASDGENFINQYTSVGRMLYRLHQNWKKL